MKNVARRYYINKVLKDKADYNYLNIFLPAKSTEKKLFVLCVTANRLLNKL